MEDDGRKAKTSQRQNQSNNEKTMQAFFDSRLKMTQRINEYFESLKKYQETLRRLSLFVRPLNLEDHTMEPYGIKDSASQSPYHSDKRSNVHNELKKYQETLRRLNLFVRPLNLEDHPMEPYGIKDSASQSPYHSDKRSNVHNELKKNQETLRPPKSTSFSGGLFVRPLNLEDHTMERYGIKDSASQSPYHSDKRSNVHNELKKYQESLRRLSLFVRPLYLEDHTMEPYGIKDSASQSPYHSDKRSNVHNEWEKIQETLRRLIMPLKHYTTPSVVKDESTIQNRDKADRSQKVTDSPEVLDTHLTKVPQNNWRERIFNLRWKHLSVHQFIVVFLLMISSVQGITSHCGTIRTMNCTQLFLTCNFDTDINQLARNLYMNHVQNNSVDLEIILVCKRSSKGFHCEASPSYEFVSVESNRLTVKIPKVNLEHGGKYWCNVYGLDIDQKVCQLDLTDSSSEDCFEQENRPSGKDDRLSPATIAIIVLSITLLLVTSLIVIYFRSSGRAKYIATCFNLKNSILGRSAPTTNTKEECEKL